MTPAAWVRGLLLEGVDDAVEEDVVEEEEGSEPGVNGGADSRRAGRPTLLKLAVQGGQVGVDNRAGEVLGQEVSGVGGPTDLEEREMTSTQPLLHPQLTHGQVPDSPNPAPPADANCSGAVGVELDGEVKAQVLGEGLQANTLGGRLGDTPQAPPHPS